MQRRALRQRAACGAPLSAVRCAAAAQSTRDVVLDCELVAKFGDDALAMVEIPARFVEDVRPGSARHRGRDQRRASRGRDDAGAAPRPFSQPRTLLDAALDDALPEYSSARKRLGSGAGV